MLNSFDYALHISTSFCSTYSIEIHLCSYDKLNKNWSSTTYEFESSIPISTYSLAVVIAQLSSTEHELRSTDTTITIFSTKTIFGEMDFIRDVILKAFEFYLDYFKVGSTQETPTKNLDILILPNFREMKTEKYGLIMLE